MSSINFAAQETPVYGRQHRQPNPTARIETYNQMQAEKENRRLSKAAKKSTGHGATPAASRPQPRPLNFSRTPQNLAPPANAAPSIQAPAHSMAHPSLMQPPADRFPHPGTPRMVSAPTQRLHISAPGDDAAAHVLTQLPQELEPRGLTQDIDDFSAEERAELEQDPDADQPNPGSDSEDDEYHGRHAVNADKGFNAASPPVDTQIASTPVNLVLTRKPTRRVVNDSSPAVSTPAPTLAYHTPTPTIPYSTNPRGLVRRTHATHPFIPAANSPDPRSSPTPAPSKRAISEVDGARDERDEEHYSDADEDTVIVLRASDLPPVRRRIFDTAARHMRLGVVSEAPYGDTIQMHQLGVASWFASQKELRETHGYEGVAQPTQDELDLLKARSHQVKGDIKTIAHEVADGKKGYGFKDGKSPEDIAYNRQLVTTLLTGNAFLFKDPMNRNVPGTLYEHPALQEILNRAFYNDENNSEAIRTPSYFANGAPLTLLAVFANALECVITERATGQLVKCHMSAKTWQPKYEKHLKILEDWKVYTTNSGSHLTQKLQIRMIQDARRYARVDVTPVGFEDAGISTADFAKNDA